MALSQEHGRPPGHWLEGHSLGPHPNLRGTETQKAVLTNRLGGSEAHPYSRTSGLGQLLVLEKRNERVDLPKATEQNTAGSGTPTGPTQMATQAGNKEHPSMAHPTYQLSPAPPPPPPPPAAFADATPSAPAAVRALQLGAPANGLPPSEERCPDSGALSLTRIQCPGKLYSLLQEQDSAHGS